MLLLKGVAELVDQRPQVIIELVQMSVLRELFLNFLFCSFKFFAYYDFFLVFDLDLDKFGN